MTTITSRESDVGPPKTLRWMGYGLSGVAALFLLMDGVMKLLAIPVVLETTALLGYPGTEAFARELGICLLTCVALYIYPRTAILDAVLLTGYLGGAVATHVRVGSPLFTHILFGVYVGLFVWAGLYLRDARLRAIFPWRLGA